MALALAFIVFLLVDAYLFRQGYDTFMWSHKTPAEKQIQQAIITSRRLPMNNLNPQTINPAYVQISKKEAAAILGISVAELDRRRGNDPFCPKGFKERDDRMAPVRFRLSDIYTYSAKIMECAFEAEVTQAKEA